MFLEEAICNQRDMAEYGGNRELSGSKLSISQLIILNYTPRVIMSEEGNRQWCQIAEDFKAILPPLSFRNYEDNETAPTVGAHVHAQQHTMS